MKIKIEKQHKELIIASFESQLIQNMLDIYYCKLDNEDLLLSISEMKYLMKLLNKIQKNNWNFDSQTYINKIIGFISVNEILEKNGYINF